MSIRQDLHTKDGLATYAAGMNASVGDKAKILPFVKPGNILEVGCANGTVLEMVSANNSDSLCVGIDLSAQLLSLASKRQYAGETLLYRADAQNIAGVAGMPQKYDTIIFCSVLHEIFSKYLQEHSASGQRDCEKVAYADTIAFVDNICQRHLNVHGNVIIRDGIKPLDQKIHIQRFKNPEIEEKFFKFADDFTPFKIEFGFNASTDTIDISSRHLFEFLTKYFYDKNWDVEVTEQFGWATVREIKESLGVFWTKPKFGLVHVEDYTLEFLKNKWQNDLEMTDGTGKECWPASTMLFVAEKLCQ